jgi:CHAT domain-containing protein
LDKNKNIELLLYGGIDFDKSDSSVNNETPLTDFNEMATRSGISGWNYLEGTVNEINQIATKAKQYNFKAEIKTNRDATEESIKKLDGKSTPYVLHLATHGFFFPDPEQEIIEEKWLSSDEMTKAKIYKTSEDPMMRSGLLLAGANKYWKKTAEEQNTDDGILTAKEISNLDLSACELVVMSACETGLGDIKGSEGVFGLQRAFKMAGVKNIIMSLWKVPDAQTSELFDVFYEECFSGKSIHDSFKTAQSKMKAKYSPYYWAGFVLLE